MEIFRADLHIHSLLSPCGDLEMSPANIVAQAMAQNLHIIAITDHNSLRQAPLVKKLAAKQGIFTLCGAEVTTREEVHCLALFGNTQAQEIFQNYLDEHLPDIKNDPQYFGHQVVVDEQEMIVLEEEKLLISAINQTIDQVERKVHELNGLFIPAHIDRKKFSLVSQLGFVPPGLNADAYEISGHTTIKEILRMFPYLKNNVFIRSSDAHLPSQIGASVTLLQIQTPSFEEIKMAFAATEGRRVVYSDMDA